ncbi:MAG: amidohydrolase family protein [Thermoproteota archaeon]
MGLNKGVTVALCGRVFTAAGKGIIENGCVVYREGAIVDVGTRGEVEIPGDAHVVELPGATFMPGLVDAHIHFTGLRTGDYIKEPLVTPYATLVARAIRDLEALLEAGYTTVVDTGGLIALQLRQAEREGTISSPRIVAAGPPVSQTFGHGDVHYLPAEYVDVRTSRLQLPFQPLLCDGADECRKAARYALRMGVDFIKVFTTGGVASQLDRPEYPQMTAEELEAVVEEARRARRFVHAHAEGAEGIVNALRAGITRIAHAMFIDDEGIGLALERNAVLIPTLSIARLLAERGEELGVPEWAVEKAREVHRVHVENIRRAYRAGVRMATGTDFFFNPEGVPTYGRNSMEVVALVEEVGMAASEALEAATRHAAYVAGLDHCAGSLEKGYVADIAAVKDNPLDDPKVLLDPDNVLLVVKEGTVQKNLTEQSIPDTPPANPVCTPK